MNIKFLFLILIYSSDLFAHTCVISSAFRLMHSTRSRAEVLLNAHRLAEIESGMQFSKHYVTNGRDTDFLKTLKRAIDDGCNAILGLYTSRECVLAGPILKKKDLIAISPSCSHDKIRSYYPHITTFVPSLESYSKAIVERVGTKKILVVRQKSDLYSLHLSRHISKFVKKTHLSYFDLDREGLPKSDKFDHGKSDVIVFTTYPLPSFTALKYLSQMEGKDKVLIVGAPSWPYDLDLLKKQRDHFEKFAGVEVPDFMNLDKNSDFYKLYTSKFEQVPYNLAALSYHLSLSVLKCSKSSNNNKVNAKSIRKCLQDNTWDGITGKVKFKKGDPFVERDIKMHELIPRLKH